VAPSIKITPGFAKYFELRYLKNGCGKVSTACAVGALKQSDEVRINDRNSRTFLIITP